MRDQRDQRDIDPEVLRDLQLRSRTSQDRGDGDPTLTRWSPPPAIETWSCRGGCGARIEITREGIDARDAMNAELRRRGEQPVQDDEIAWCPRCKARHDRERAQVTARSRTEVSRLTAELRTLVDNDLRERPILARLRQLGEDADRILADVRAQRRAAATNKATNRRSTI